MPVIINGHSNFCKLFHFFRHVTESGWKLDQSVTPGQCFVLSTHCTVWRWPSPSDDIIIEGKHLHDVDLLILLLVLSHTKQTTMLHTTNIIILQPGFVSTRRKAPYWALSSRPWAKIVSKIVCHGVPTTLSKNSVKNSVSRVANEALIVRFTHIFIFLLLIQSLKCQWAPFYSFLWVHYRVKKKIKRLGLKYRRNVNFCWRKDIGQIVNVKLNFTLNFMNTTKFKNIFL